MSKLPIILSVVLCLGLLPLGSCGPATSSPAAPASPTAAMATAGAPAAPTSTHTPEPTATAAPPTRTPGATPTGEPPTASPVPTQPPLPSTAAPPEPAVTGAARPLVISFRVSPTTTLNLGDELTVTWEAAGQKADLCPISGPGPIEARCLDVPLTGSTRLVTNEEAMVYTGLGLRVTGGGTFTWSVVNIRLQCQNLRPWFFAHPPERCPAGLVHESRAAGQYFERGLMVWVENPDSFYVLYRGRDESGFQVFDWISDIRLRPGASPDHRLGEQPPAGLYEPVSGFGMVWRGEIEGVRADVRQRLGWATEPELGFDTAYQCETVFYPGLWNCFLRGPRGEVFSLRPDSTAQVRWLWDEWPPSP
jgi:hypothetical protein